MNHQQSWQLGKFGILILPWFPALGEICLVITLIIVWKQNFRQIISNRSFWILGIISVGLILISCFAFKPIESFLGLGNFLPFFAFFVAFNFLIQKLFHLRQLAWLLIIPSLPIVILGLGQVWVNWQTPGIILKILGWELVAGGNPGGRISSVFMYANICAAYLLIVFILALGLLVDWYLNWQERRLTIKTEREKINQEKEIKFKGDVGTFWLLLIIVMINALGLIFTSSRNAWGIAFLATLAFALYLSWYWLILGVGLIISTILGSAFGVNPWRDWLRKVVPAYFWARLSDEMYPDRPLATLRKTQWEFALNLTQQRPWFGWGLRNFTPLYEVKWQVWLGHPHNLFLMLSAETGIVTTLFFCGWVGWILGQAIQLLIQKLANQKKSGLIVFTYLVAFASLVLFNLFDVTVFDLRMNTIGWLLLAAIAGVVSSNQK